MRIKLLDGVTAANGAPTAATAGFSLRTLANGLAPANALDTAALTALSTAGSGTMTVTIKIWLRQQGLSMEWAPAGAHATAATRGIMNAGNAIDEVGTDLLRHTELIEGLACYSDIYAEVVTIGGTATAVDLWLSAP